MEMEVVSQEPLVPAPISVGSRSRIILDHLAVVAQEVVSSTLSLQALLHHLGRLKLPAPGLGVGEEFLEARSRQQQVYLALQIQVPQHPAEVCSTRLLALVLVLPPVVSAPREEGGLAVTHNHPNLIKEASHLVAQEHLTPLERLLAVPIPPVGAVSLEADKVLLASEASSSNSSSSSKEPQILSGILAPISPKGRLPIRPDLDLAAVNQHQNPGGFSGLRLLALEGPAQGYLATFQPTMHSSLKREAFLEPTVTIRSEEVRFLGQSRRRQEDPFLASILQTRLPPAGVGFSTLRGLVPIIIALRISTIRGVVCLMATSSSSSSLSYSAPAVQRWEVGCSILTATHNNRQRAAQFSGTWVPTLNPAFSQLPIMQLISSQIQHNNRMHYSHRNLR